MHPISVDQRISRIFELFSKFSDVGYIGEPVSQLQHALQCAYFAEKSGASESAILAALLHDIGHLCAPDDAPQMHDLGVLYHEEIGARWLAELGFSAEVQKLVQGHVQAKRYLVFKYESYASKLSEASRGTLAFQGGPMTATEAQHFESDALFKTILAVRHWDESAKDPDLQVPGPEHYLPLFRKHLSTH